MYSQRLYCEIPVMRQRRADKRGVQRAVRISIARTVAVGRARSTTSHGHLGTRHQSFRLSSPRFTIRFWTLRLNPL